MCNVWQEMKLLIMNEHMLQMLYEYSVYLYIDVFLR